MNLSFVWIISVYFIVSGSDPDICCNKKTVSGTENGLDGEFILVRSHVPGPEDALCFDKCVYKR